MDYSRLYPIMGFEGHGAFNRWWIHKTYRHNSNRYHSYTPRGHIIAKYYYPRNLRTGKQQGPRSIFYDAVKDWQKKDDDIKNYYNQWAKNRPLSGYNRYISLFLQANKNMIIYWKTLEKDAADISTIPQYIASGYVPSVHFARNIYWESQKQESGKPATIFDYFGTGAPYMKNKTLETPKIHGEISGNPTAPKTFYTTNLYLPDGFMINGKIVATVASNNLTVSIKGKDGNDPSVTNPVTVMIAGVERIITSALSVTKNAGTNWCNSGSAELATQEVDYFVYLGYNATDGIVIGFARIPNAGIYSDFSATSTNSKYCAISTITNASSGDNYQVIGRFCATLSAGAGYTWTVPTFTNKNLIQRPIYQTRVLSATVNETWVGGTAPTGSPAIHFVRYIFNENKIDVWGSAYTYTPGSGNTYLKVKTPINATIFQNASGRVGTPGASATNDSAISYSDGSGVEIWCTACNAAQWNFYCSYMY